MKNLILSLGIISFLAVGCKSTTGTSTSSNNTSTNNTEVTDKKKSDTNTPTDTSPSTPVTGKSLRNENLPVE